jgi:nitroimidazol reductase NimA-like FMN-containing flavoprotein (pyridoxamine 5'-phosphate oxidase superfamily)
MIEELTPDEIEEFLDQQVIGRVGCHVDGLTYVVPVIFAWSDGSAYVYTVEGQKVRMMRANPDVCFEVDEYRAGGSWRSVIIEGQYEELAGEDAAETLRLLSGRFAGRTSSASGRSEGERGPERPRGEGRSPVAFRIKAGEVTGRKVDR